MKLSMEKQTCYFLLNYASCGQKMMELLSFMSWLAIFFWIMQHRLALQRKRTCFSSTCYFLLNYANCTGETISRQGRKSSLLFSFELCQHEVECPTRSVVFRTCYFLLNYAPWLKPRAEAILKLASLLFSFELCRTRRWSTRRCHRLSHLAIFFWIMRISNGFTTETIVSTSCYFLLNYARPACRVSSPTLAGRLAIFFWIMLVLFLGEEAWESDADLAIFFWIMLAEEVQRRHPYSWRRSTCYFLLNYALAYIAIKAQQLGINRKLAIFFWIMRKASVCIWAKKRPTPSLLFSFELCPRIGNQ